jgi:hypothetical protein
VIFTQSVGFALFDLSKRPKTAFFEGFRVFPAILPYCGVTSPYCGAAPQFAERHFHIAT